MMQHERNADYARKLAAAHAQAQAAGMARWQYDDWFERFLRKIGLRLRPRPYQHLGWVWVRWFGFMAVIFGNWLWGGWALDMSTTRLAVITASVAALLAGIKVMILMAERRKYNLTPWSAL